MSRRCDLFRVLVKDPAHYMRELADEGLQEGVCAQTPKDGGIPGQTPLRTR